MGIKNFSKTFNSVRNVKSKDLKNMTLAIDAMTELYRASLGAKTIDLLTDDEGNPTLFISVLISNILEFHKNNVNQIWVFDYDQDPDKSFHNPAKLDELIKRKQKKQLAKEKINKLKEDPLFSDDEEDSTDVIDSTSEVKETKLVEEKQDKINSLEKQLFSVNKNIINEVKLILNCLNIKWVDAPHGFEGECIASYLNIVGIADAVYSSDTDPVAFGAKKLLRKNPKDKKIYEYTQDNILEQIQNINSDHYPDIYDIRKISVILGTDVCDKTAGIGSKTVIKKYRNIKLTKKQEQAIEFFETHPTTPLYINNENKQPFININLDELLLWLVNIKKFKEHIWKPRFLKVMNMDNDNADNKANNNADNKANNNADNKAYNKANNKADNNADNDNADNKGKNKKKGVMKNKKNIIKPMPGKSILRKINT
jgi:hypothetical protein